MRVMLIGGGKVVYFLARAFASRGYDVTVVNRNDEECVALSRKLKATVVKGDGSLPAVLEEAGARRADVVLAVTPNDQDNLVACQLASRLYGVPRSIALVNDPDNEEVFKKLGVTAAFSTTHVIASMIEQRAALEEIVNLVPVAEGRLTVTEVVLGEGAPAVGKPLQELGLPQGSLVGAVLREGRAIVPRGPDRLESGDRLTLISTPESYGPALRALVGKEA